jgi:hypothetical protein
MVPSHQLNLDISFVPDPKRHRDCSPNSENTLDRRTPRELEEIL